jgi:hypothetical protein
LYSVFWRACSQSESVLHKGQAISKDEMPALPACISLFSIARALLLFFCDTQQVSTAFIARGNKDNKIK